MAGMLHTTLAGVLFLSALGFSPAAGLSAQNPLARPAKAEHPFAGAFDGKDIALELGLGQEHEYQGTLTFAGQRYPCTADAAAGGLRGSFAVAGRNFEFTARLDGAQLSLSSDGSDYELTRRDNPLHRGPAPQPPGIQPAPVPPPAAPAATVGGVGIAFGPNADGELVVKAILPNGPASKTGLKPGGVLVAVDGKDIDGIAPEQLRAMLQGPVGSLVKLTIDTDTEVLDVVIQRGAIPANAPPPQLDGPGGLQPRPQPPQPGVEPAPPMPPVQPGNDRGEAPVAGMPAWLQAGARVTWWAGSASLPGVSSRLVLNEKGLWVDRNGRRYGVESTMGAGGMGYQQLNIVHVGGDGIAADMRSYLIADPQTQDAILTSSAGCSGTAQNLGDYWVNPQQLQKLQDGETGGTRIVHGPYELEGRKFDAVSVRTDTEAGFSQYTYDLATGLCLASSTSGTSAPVWVANGNNSTAGAGTTYITQTHLVAMRQLQLPWANDGLPQDLRAGSSLDYRGTYRTEIPGSPVLPWQFAATVQIDRIGAGFATGKLRTHLDSGMGMPQDGEQSRVFGANMIGGLFVSPQTLRQLRPQQLLDEDPTTHVRTYVGEAQNGAVAIIEQGPTQEAVYAYDMQSGMLVANSQRQKSGVATIVLQVQLARR